MDSRIFLVGHGLAHSFGAMVTMCVCDLPNGTGGKNMKKFKEWLEPDSITETKIAEPAWDLLAYLAYDTVQQVCPSVCVV